MIKEEDEIKLYHIVCDISKICKEYFYARKYLPKHYWKIDDVVKSIYSSSKDLKTTYSNLKKNNKSEER